MTQQFVYFLRITANEYNALYQMYLDNTDCYFSHQPMNAALLLLTDVKKNKKYG